MWTKNVSLKDFSKPLKYIGSPFYESYQLESITYPLVNQTEEEAIELLGTFPKNITTCMFGYTSETNWELLCLLENSMYVWMNATCDDEGFGSGGEMYLYVSKDLKEITDEAMSETARKAFYEIYGKNV